MMFDIQRFGDNDTITSAKEGKLVVEFYDGDNRTIPIDNPRDDLTAADINSFVNTLKTTQPLVGDKSGTASIVGASSFVIHEQTKVNLDLS